MTLHAFQHALADLSASLEMGERVLADPDAALAPYDLTPLERRRIEAAAKQQGLRVNVYLYRYNRIITLMTVMPGTMLLLGADGRAVADQYWTEGGPDRNMRRESEHFARFLLAEIDAGRITVPYLRDAVNFEIARYQIAMAPGTMLHQQVAEAAERWPDGPLALHPLIRVVAFAHDPATLLSHLAWKRPPPYADVAEGEFYLYIDGRQGGFDNHPVDVATGRLLADVAAGLDIDPAEAERLEREGLLVRTAPELAMAGSAASAVGSSA
jgi:hypothetical protein